MGAVLSVERVSDSEFSSTMQLIAHVQISAAVTWQGLFSLLAPCRCMLESATHSLYSRHRCSSREFITLHCALRKEP